MLNARFAAHCKALSKQGVLQTFPTDFREDQNVVPAWIILPTWPMYGRWWAFTIAAAVVSGVFVPYAVGFCADPGDW